MAIAARWPPAREDPLSALLIALLADDPAAYDDVQPVLAARQMELRHYEHADALLGQLDDEQFEPALVLVEIGLAGMDGIELCQHVVARRPGSRVVLVSHQRAFDTALAALRCAAFDLLVHPVSGDEFEHTLNRALRTHTLSEKVERLRLALAEATGFAELIGVSQPMQTLYGLLERAARTRASVLITGESGTGKELVARALHKHSKRASGPFLAVNCSAIPDSLIESELFGHTRGAFTDARRERRGLFLEASGGTLFLDEIGDMPMAVQPKLLRALQERTIRPVGGDREVPIDVRVVAATNINLETAVAERKFREDLYYRINVIHIDLPPLRERSSDILLIAQHFIEHFALQADRPVIGVSAEAAEKLLAYNWPGNIRELQNCVERAVSLTQHTELQVEDLPAKVANHRPSHVLVVANNPSELLPMAQVERRYIHRVMQAVRGNKREAARVLGFDRKTLYRKLERYNIEVARPGKSKEV